MSSAAETISEMLCQVWIRKLITHILHEHSQLMLTAERTSISCDKLTNIDQNVLYYICGYMARTLKAASRRFSKIRDMEELTSCLATKEFKSSAHFTDKYKLWVEKQSRGALLFPIPIFYMLVREFYTIFRIIFISGQLSVSSLNRDQLKQQC